MNEISGVLRLSALWQAETKRRAARLMRGLFVLAVVVGAHVARVGSGAARAVAAGLIAAALIASVVRSRREQKRLMTPEGVIRQVLIPTDPSLAQRALRAHSLVRDAERDETVGSLELSRLHFRRVLDRVSPEAVTRAASRRATVLSLWLLAVVCATGFGLLIEPMRVVEGLDVLVARRGVAPVPLSWLGLVRVSVQPPAYLHGSEQAIFPSFLSEVPEGSVVIVRGVPERRGRKLVLSDGQQEVLFVEDGSDNLVARWTLKTKATLRVAARFGKVLIPEADAIQLVPTPDQPPEIELEDAPRTVSLKEIDRLEFRYLVTDDHGLKQIDLVLRTGGREDRRTLIRLDGQSRLERGAHAVNARDPFFRRAFLPVLASVEARDNDVNHGERWGKSEVITILPPAVGEPQALRYQALSKARDKLIALLDQVAATERARKDHSSQAMLDERDKEKQKLKSDALTELRAAVRSGFAGARISSGLSAFLLGQARALERRTGDERRRSEDALLALDAALRALAYRDAGEVSRRLGDVAEEAAEGAKFGVAGERRDQGRRRLRTALITLDQGTDNLILLGTLGRDLGSVARGEIRRIRRAEAAGSFSDAELAARHLAARLRRPNPSFSSAGGGGVESGRGANGPGEASDADRQFDAMMRELESLASEHAEQIRDVESKLADADRISGSDELKREAAERAARLRTRMAELPEPGAQPGSARAAAAVAREHMNAMAQNLERLALKDAVESGRQGQGQLSEAARLAKDPRSASDWLDEAGLSEASRELNEQLGWAQQNLEKLRQRALAKAPEELAESAAREQGLARRAGNIAGRGEHSEAKLPQEVQDALERAESAMQDASRELSAGRGEQGLELQREAQRLLERASPGSTTDNDDSRSRPESGQEDGGEMATHGHVPPVDKARRAEEFRRRVLEGLSNERRGRLSPAVERYAEGLLE